MNSNEVKKFLIYWTVNSILIALITYLLPNYYELGNMNLTPFSAIVVSGFALTLVGYLAKIFARGAGINKKGRYQALIFYGIANSAGIWIIARVADLTGFGIARYYWALVLGFLASITHWLVRQGLKKYRVIK